MSRLSSRPEIHHQTISERYQHIDVLRGVAALSVVWLHTSAVFVPNEPALIWLNQHFEFGRAGVVLFFIISGFVIPASFEGSRVDGTRRFLIRRFFRLYPAYILSLILSLIIIEWLHQGRAPELNSVIAHLTMFQEYLTFPSVNGGYWTLAIELMFYGICLMMFWAGVINSPKAFVALVSACIVVLAIWVYVLSPIWWSGLRLKEKLVFAFIYGQHGPWENHTFQTLIHLGLMGLGALLRFWYEGQLDRRIKIFVSVILFYWLFDNFIHDIKSRDFVALKVHLSYSVAVCVFVIFGCLVKIRSRPIAYVGLISYSLYLLHPVVTHGLHWFLLLVGMRHYWGWGLLITAFCLSLALSAAAYHLIEKPFIKLGRTLSWMSDEPNLKLSRRTPTA